jgi:hypothetical protein
VEINENGPGIGFWISVGTGALAGIIALVAGAGLVVSAVIWVVVTVTLVLLLS